jgi:hypothetical protein
MVPLSASNATPRPADLAITGNLMLTTLLRRIHALGFRELAPGNMGRSLVLMMISFHAGIATADGDPATVTELAADIGMPAATLRSYVAMLVKHKRVKLIISRKRGKGQEQRIAVDLDRLDKLMTLDHVDASIEIIEGGLNELKRLRQLLLPQLMANGNGRAAAE